MRVIRPAYLVDRLVLQELSRETPSLALVYLNEFKTATAAFILQNNDAKKLKVVCVCVCDDIIIDGMFMGTVTVTDMGRMYTQGPRSV